MGIESNACYGQPVVDFNKRNFTDSIEVNEILHYRIRDFYRNSHQSKHVHKDNFKILKKEFYNLEKIVLRNLIFKKLNMKNLESMICQNNGTGEISVV